MAGPGGSIDIRQEGRKTLAINVKKVGGKVKEIGG